VRARRAAAAAFFLAVGPVALAESRAAEVAAWLTGTFEAKDPAADGGAVRIVIVSVPKSRIANGSPVLYREQAALPKLDEPSLQRFYRLEEVGEVVRLRAFDPKDPLIVRGKWRDPSALALYGASDVRERPGCELALKRVGARWEGGTPETTPQAACPSNLRNAVRMTSSVTLSKDELMQWDRGFDEKGKQRWGSREGGTTFVKRSASAPVDDALLERTVGRRPETAPTPAALTVTAPAAAQQGRVEERFSERASSSILLVYDGQRVEPGLERILLSALELAYADLVRDFGSGPVEKVVVVVYAERDFLAATHAPSWANGFFDGRVRVPARGITGVTPELLSVLRHEMTHSFVHFRAKGRAPTWLHEGLAQLEEGKTAAPVASALTGAYAARGTFSLSALEGRFTGFSASGARSGYAVSLAVAEMLRDTRGFGALAHFLDRLGEGGSVEEAMREELRADYPRLESDLADWLKRRAR